MDWRKSSQSYGNGDCVEVAGYVGVGTGRTPTDPCSAAPVRSGTCSWGASRAASSTVTRRSRRRYRNEG